MRLSGVLNDTMQAQPAVTAQDQSFGCGTENRTQLHRLSAERPHQQALPQNLVGPVRLELTTFDLKGRYSNQLSYDPGRKESREPLVSAFRVKLYSL
jgi:hypothetical protein